MTEKKNRKNLPNSGVIGDEEAESALWRNVVIQAIADATTVKLTDSRGAYSQQMEIIRGQARRWLKMQTDDFRYVCELAGLQHDRVHAFAMSRIREANEREQARVAENLKGSGTRKNVEVSGRGVVEDFSEGGPDRHPSATRETTEIEFLQNGDLPQ